MLVGWWSDGWPGVPTLWYRSPLGHREEETQWPSGRTIMQTHQQSVDSRGLQQYRPIQWLVGCSVVCHTPWCQKTLGHSHFHRPPQEQTVLFSKIIQHCTQCTQLSSEIMATLWFLRHNLSFIKTGSSMWRFEEYRQFPFLYGNLAFSSPFGGKTRRKLCKSGD